MSLVRATGQVRLLSQFKESKHLCDTLKGFLNSIKGTNFKMTAFIFSPPRAMAILKTAEPNMKPEMSGTWAPHTKCQRNIAPESFSQMPLCTSSSYGAFVKTC